jgi:hypothetical protein
MIYAEPLFHRLIGPLLLEASQMFKQLPSFPRLLAAPFINLKYIICPRKLFSYWVLWIMNLVYSLPVIQDLLIAFAFPFSFIFISNLAHTISLFQDRDHGGTYPHCAFLLFSFGALNHRSYFHWVWARSSRLIKNRNRQNIFLTSNSL